jgi:hypothetical protein
LKLSLLILLCIFIFTSPIIYASESNLDDTVFEDFRVTIDGQVFKFVQPAIYENEELYLPMRSFLSIFGAKLTWDEQETAATILADDKEYLLDIDLENSSLELTENKVLNVKIVDSQIYIPLSCIKSILNYDFTWDNENELLRATKIADSQTIFGNLPECPEFKVVDTFTGTASWYGGKFHGRKTNSGEIFDENALTAAHKTLPFNTYIRVTFLKTNESTIVRINDRGPHVASRILDLSKGAAEEIGLKPHGLGEVKVEVLEMTK